MGSRGAHLAERSWKPHLAAGQVTLWHSWPLSGLYLRAALVFLETGLESLGLCKVSQVSRCVPTSPGRAPTQGSLLCFWTFSLHTLNSGQGGQTAFSYSWGCWSLGNEEHRGLQRLCPWGPQGNTAQLHTLGLRNDDLARFTEAASDSCLVHLSLHNPSVHMN